MTRRLSVSILGTRGIPAHYGGFETFAEAIACRLAARGWRIRVYGRPGSVGEGVLPPGVESVLLPAIKTKHFETVSHTALSFLHLRRHPTDVALCCNLANAPFVSLGTRAGIPTALLVDGFEAKRAKWGFSGRGWLAGAERLARRLPSAIVADAEVIERYWREKSAVAVRRIAYGVEPLSDPGDGILKELGLEPDGYFLYVSRLEPENNAHRVIAAYRRVGGSLPLTIVGHAPYARRYIQQLHRLADPRVRFVGGRYGQSYRQLQTHCRAYIHATEVGGTHPALLEGLAWSPLAIVHDTPENREVAGDACLYFGYRDERQLAEIIDDISENPQRRGTIHARALARMATHYNWEGVVAAYEELLWELAAMR